MQRFVEKLGALTFTGRAVRASEATQSVSVDPDRWRTHYGGTTKER
jgi:hypothetical protein